MLVVEADERRSLLNAEEDELGRGLCEAVIVFAAGLMLTFRDSFLPFAAAAGEEEDEEQEATPPAGRATGAADDPGAPTAFRLDVDERPVTVRVRIT